MTEAIDHMLDQLIASAIHFNHTEQDSAYNYQLSFSYNVKVPPLALPRSGSASTPGSIRWHELIRALTLLELVSEKLRPLQKSILQNLLQPLIQFHKNSTLELLSSASNYASAEGSSISLSINRSNGRSGQGTISPLGTLIDHQPSTHTHNSIIFIATIFDDVLRVFEYIHQDVFLNQYSSPEFNAQQVFSDTEILTHVAGRHIAKEASAMILKFYLTEIIPLDINELNQFGSISSAVIRFEDDLIAMGESMDKYAFSRNAGMILPAYVHTLSPVRL